MKHNSEKLVAGAVIGGVLSVVAALLLTPTSGSCIRKGLGDTCDSITDSTKKLSKSVCCHTDNLTDKIKCLIGLKEETPIEHECPVTDVFIGVAIGSVLGAIAGLAIAKKPGAELREDLYATYNTLSDKTQETAADFRRQGEVFIKNTKKKANKWLDFAKNTMSEFSEDAEQVEEEFMEKARDQMNNIMEWAKVGMKLWQALKKR